jgi:hypothetical protein
MNQSPLSRRAKTDMAAATVKRIRFAEPDISEPAAGAILLRFTQPRRIAAVEEPFELSKLFADRPGPEASADLWVVLASAALPLDLEKTVHRWMSPPERPDALQYNDAPQYNDASLRLDALQPVIVKLESGTIRWRPGRAVLGGAAANSKSILSAVAAFAFFEGELRRLEEALLPYQASAPADAALAYRIRQNSRAEWERLGQTMEALSVLRLTFARLEPLLATPPRALDLEGRRAAAGLAARSGVQARLESFSDRLEACEDLYEGAVDRISDFRWYRKGEILEITIIVLLALEAILIAWQLFGRS